MDQCRSTPSEKTIKYFIIRSQGANKFLLDFVHYITIEVSIIFINGNKKNININKIKKILKEMIIIEI